MACKEPKSIKEKTESDWAKEEKKLLPDKYYLHLYLIRGLKDKNIEKIVPFAPTPVVHDYCDVIHLVVEAPTRVQVSSQDPNPLEQGYYDWTGQPNKPDVLTYKKDENQNQGENVNLSANFNSESRIPESVRAETKTSGFLFDMPVVTYDEDPYWWLPVAQVIYNRSQSKVSFTIEKDGTLSIHSDNDNSSNKKPFNLKFTRDGHEYKGVEDSDGEYYRSKSVEDLARTVADLVQIADEGEEILNN